MREAIEDGYILNPAGFIFKWVVAMEYQVPVGMSNEEEKYTLRKAQIYNNSDRIKEIAKRIVERALTRPSTQALGATVKRFSATSSIEAAQKYVEIRKAIEARGEQRC